MKNGSNKGGGGVIILTKKKCVEVEKVIKSEDKSEISQVMIRSGNGKIMNYVGVYVPPVTCAWQKEEHEEMLVDVLKGLEKIVMESSDIVIVSDFNCKEIN